MKLRITVKQPAGVSFDIDEPSVSLVELRRIFKETPFPILTFKQGRELMINSENVAAVELLP